MGKDLENFSGKFRERNNFDYLYSDAMYLKSKENFHPEKQWLGVCGFLIKEDKVRRYFTTLKTRDDYLLNTIIPINTCYTSFYIYDHNYIENTTLEIFWRDMAHVYSFNSIKDKDLEKQYFCTRGKILKQTESHILFEIEKHLMWAKDQEDLHKDYKYFSIPKSYIRSIKIEKNWQDAKLKKIKPEIESWILEGENSIQKIRETKNKDKNEVKIYYSFFNKKFKTGKNK